ncbi:MAG: bacteriophage abortive infection AbiH family protein [Bacteroidales bacterium]|nr:bacteriophage abortive infection AbiH family protein [Bacteroidales bacterium]
MSSDRLYVIGNGFDLHHGLRTQYSDFQAYLKKQNPSLLYLLDSCFSVDLWSDFESNLSKLDIAEIFADNEDLLPDDNSDRDGDKYVFIDKMEQIKNNLTVGLRDELRNWILALDYPSDIDRIKLNLDTNATFLTFNYSDTLERLYKINSDHIIHIHNKAIWIDLDKFSPKERSIIEISERFKAKFHEFWPQESKIRRSVLEDNSDIIIGHAVKNISLERPTTTQKGINTSYSYEEGFDMIKSYDNYKNTEQILNKNRYFFNNLHSINTIIIIGHSLSDVDIPYFEELSNKAIKCEKYKITHYGAENLKNIQVQSAKFLNINQNIDFVNLDDDIENIRHNLK